MIHPWTSASKNYLIESLKEMATKPERITRSAAKMAAASKVTSATSLPPMNLFRHMVAYVTLGLLCGWYYFLLILYPTMIYLAYFHRSYLAGCVLAVFITLTFTPLKHEPQEWFMYSWLFGVWREYFNYTYDCESIQHGKLDVKKRYMFLEFPHGVFPMGQFVSASLVDDIAPGQMVTGTAADVVFKVPVMRQVMSWLGTMPAKRASITKTLNKGYRCAIVPGGIAEMYVVNEATEALYLKSRQNTIKAAIQEGADIVPIFFFGNSRLFTVLGANKEGNGAESGLAKMSRKFRASILFFYGRHFLPVPYRQHLHMATGNVVSVTQNDQPSEEEINRVLNQVIPLVLIHSHYPSNRTLPQVIAAVQTLYIAKKPTWETRPLVIL